MSMGRELEPMGILTEDKTYNFAWRGFEKQFETYSGLGIRLRYDCRILDNEISQILCESDSWKTICD